MEEATRSGHPHTLSDTVHSGYHIGRKLGTPTINMHFPEGVIIPRHGVYAAKVYLEGGESYVAVTNVGIRPTVGEREQRHGREPSAGLQRQSVRTAGESRVYKFLRPERKFSGFEELSAQIRCDAESAKRIF